MHLSLWYVVLVCHQYDVCENYVGSVYIGGYGSLSERGLGGWGGLMSVFFILMASSGSCVLIIIIIYIYLKSNIQCI